jgi:hypothetical protein
MGGKTMLNKQFILSWIATFVAMMAYGFSPI